MLKRDNQWSLREAEGEEDAYYLITKWHHYFGARYHANELPEDLAEVAGWCEEKNIEAYGAIVTHHPSGYEGGVDIGGGLVSIVGPEEAIESLPDGDFSKEELVGERNAWLWFGAVDPVFRGQGIGQELFQARLDWVSSRDVDVVFGVGWERRKGRTSRCLFEKHGFLEIPVDDGVYTGTRESCPDCAAWPGNETECRCDAVLWMLDGSAVAGSDE